MTDILARQRASTALSTAAKAINFGAFGRRIGFLGDSITYSNGATNVIYGYANQTVEMLNGAAASVATGGSVVSGHPGYRSDQIAPFLQTDIVGKCDILVTLQGTNDTGQGISLAAYAANMIAQFKTAQQAGLRLYILTIPPRGSNANPTPAQQLSIDMYNAWLRLVAPIYGTLVDIAAFMQNPQSNFNNLLAAYDSGDGVHPSNKGHWAIACAVAKAIKPNLNRQQLLNGWSTFNLVTNPYFMSNAAAQYSTGWYEAGGTGTAPVYSFVTDTTGKLNQGYWREMDFAPGASSGFRTYATGVLSGFSVGDVVALTAKLQIIDVAGNWQTIGPAGSGTGGVSLKLMNQSGVQLAGNASPITSLGYPTAPNQYDLGPFWQTLTIPAGTTQVLIYLTVSLPAGAELKVRIGEVGLINLTTTGMVNAPLQ